MNFGKIDHYILFGGGYLLVHISLLLQKQRRNFLVITSPRHLTEQVLKKTSLEKFLNKNSIEFVVSSDINADQKLNKKITSTSLGISIGAAWIFKKSLIEKFNGKLLNLHGSRLPQNRGGGGFSWRIMRNDRLGCSMIHQIDTGIDTGNILINEDYVFPKNCITPIDFQNFAQKHYIGVIQKFLDDIQSGKNFREKTQREDLSSYWPRLNTSIHAFIDWSWCLSDIVQFIRAFDDPYHGAKTFMEGKLVKLKSSNMNITDGTFHPFQTGIIYRKSANTLFIACKEGTLLIKQIINEKNENIFPMIKLGTRLTTPNTYLEKARIRKITYTAKGIKEATNEKSISS